MNRIITLCLVFLLVATGCTNDSSNSPNDSINSCESTSDFIVETTLGTDNNNVDSTSEHFFNDTDIITVEPDTTGLYLEETEVDSTYITDLKDETTKLDISDTTDKYFEETERMIYHNCVAVQGRMLPAECYFKVYSDEHYAEVPMTSIMRALGAEVNWDGSVFAVSYNGTEWQYDTNKLDYGYLRAPGTQNGVRNHIGEELIFENASAYRTLKYYFGVTLTVDFENESIVIE